MDHNQTVTTADLATLLGVNGKMLSNYEKDGLIQKEARGKYKLSEATKVINHLRATAAGRKAAHGSIRDDESKVRKARAEADLAEAKAQEKTGQLVAIVDVRSEWRSVALKVRTGILNLSKRIGANDPALTRQQLAAIDDECRAVLEELADDKDE